MLVNYQDYEDCNGRSFLGSLQVYGVCPPMDAHAQSNPLAMLTIRACTRSARIQLEAEGFSHLRKQWIAGISAAHCEWARHSRSKLPQDWSSFIFRWIRKLGK